MIKVQLTSTQGTDREKNQDTALIIEEAGFSVHGVFDGSSNRAKSGDFVKELAAGLKLVFEKSDIKACHYNDVIPILKSLINSVRKSLSCKYPAAGCSFVLLTDIAGHPFTYTIWAGDCRLGLARKERTTWKTPAHLLATCLSQNTLINCLLAKRDCLPSGMVMARSRGQIMLATDGYWKDRPDDDSTVLILTP